MNFFSTFYFIILLGSSGAKFPDWLTTKIGIKSKLRVIDNGNIIQLSNGLISRSFSLQPGFATIDYYSHEKKSSLIRAIQPEANVTINNVNYLIGGFLTPGMSRAYLNRTALSETAIPNLLSFQFIGYETKEITPRYPYQPRRGAPSNIEWPPKGLELRVHFNPPKSFNLKCKITIHYEIFDNVPIITKWISVIAQENINIEINAIEILSLNWQWSNNMRRVTYDHTSPGYRSQSFTSLMEDLNQYISTAYMRQLNLPPLI